MSATDRITDVTERILERRRMGLKVMDHDVDALVVLCEEQAKEIERLRAERGQ